MHKSISIDEIIEKIIAFEKSTYQSNPSMVEYKLQRVKTSPFIFFRGYPVIFYAGIFQNYEALINHPINYLDETVKNCTINADLHIGNFGYIKNKKDEPHFDINDYDECTNSNYLLDLIRLLTSVYIYASYYETKEEPAKLCKIFLNSFHKKLKKFLSEEDDVQKYSIKEKNAKGFIQDKIKDLLDVKKEDFLEKYTESNKFKLDKERITISNELKIQITEALNQTYFTEIKQVFPEIKEIHVLDICEKLFSGVSSIGLHRYHVLVEIKMDKKENFIFELKETRNSTLSHFISLPSISNGKRILNGVNALATQPSKFFSCTKLNQKDYLVREISEYKSNLNLEKVKPNDSEDLCEAVAKLYCKSLFKSTKDHVQSMEKLDSWIEDKKSEWTDFYIEIAKEQTIQNTKNFEVYSNSVDTILQKLKMG